MVFEPSAGGGINHLGCRRLTAGSSDFLWLRGRSENRV